MKSTILSLVVVIFSFFLLSCVESPTGDSDEKDNDPVRDEGRNDKKEELYILTGTVGDMNDNPLSGVNVIISGQQITRSTTTNSNGEYYFTNLKKGSYTVTAEKEGYVPVINNGISKVYVDGKQGNAGFLFYRNVQKKEIQLTVSEDTCLDERRPDKNYGSSDIIYTGYEDFRDEVVHRNNPQKGKIYYKYALIRFNIPQIPADAHIVSATLMIHFFTSPKTYTTLFVSKINSCPNGNWSEGSASLKDLPTDLTLIDILSEEISRNTVSFFDVKEAVKEWINESHSNYGFRINSMNNETMHDHCYFYSSDASLRIVYEF